MKFSDIIHGAEILDLRGEAEVTGVQYDSRRVRPGDVFVAMKGGSTDGNRYLDAAIEAGAVAIVTDSPDGAPPAGFPDVAWARVPHGRRALASLSANLLRHPARRLAITGVTGTNGKTTTTHLLEAILQGAGRTTALVGTIENRIAGRSVPAPHTTPEPLETQSFFAEAVRAGATEVVMEVSSHALDQERVHGIHFDVAVFTNLTRDHLDYHTDMESYFAAKERLFTGCGSLPPRVAVLNQEDAHGRRLVEVCRGNIATVWTYGVRDGDFHARDLEPGRNGTRFTMATPEGTVEVFTPLAGRVNVYNVLAASAAAMARGCSRSQVADAVRRLTHVPGRFQRVDFGQPFSVVVDYAHTDDALVNLTAVARDFVQESGLGGRVLTVFGCGGGRDRSKRPLMGEAAGDGSDLVFLTSDNPRQEPPLAIIHDALQGLLRSRAEFIIEPDREKAIHLAMRLARPGDIVLLAGKGHEKLQIHADGTVPFDDAEVAERALKAAGYGLSDHYRAEATA